MNTAIRVAMVIAGIIVVIAIAMFTVAVFTVKSLMARGYSTKLYGVRMSNPGLYFPPRLVELWNTGKKEAVK